MATMEPPSLPPPSSDGQPDPFLATAVEQARFLAPTASVAVAPASARRVPSLFYSSPLPSSSPRPGMEDLGAPPKGRIDLRTRPFNALFVPPPAVTTPTDEMASCNNKENSTASDSFERPLKVKALKFNASHLKSSNSVPKHRLHTPSFLPTPPPSSSPDIPLVALNAASAAESASSQFNSEAEEEDSYVQNLLLSRSSVFGSPSKVKPSSTSTPTYLLLRSAALEAPRSILKSWTYELSRTQASSEAEGTRRNGGKRKHQLTFVDSYIPLSPLGKTGVGRPGKRARIEDGDSSSPSVSVVAARGLSEKMQGVLMASRDAGSASGNTSAHFASSSAAAPAGNGTGGPARGGDPTKAPSGAGGAGEQPPPPPEGALPSKPVAESSGSSLPNISSPLMTLKASLRPEAQPHLTSRLEASAMEGSGIDSALLPRPLSPRSSAAADEEEHRAAVYESLARRGGRRLPPSPSLRAVSTPGPDDMDEDLHVPVTIFEVEKAYVTLTRTLHALPSSVTEDSPALAPLRQQTGVLVQCLMRDITNVLSPPPGSGDQAEDSSPAGARSPSREGWSIRRQQDETGLAVAAIKCATLITTQKRLWALFTENQLSTIFGAILKITSSKHITEMKSRELHAFHNWFLSKQELPLSMLERQLDKIIASLKRSLTVDDKKSRARPDAFDAVSRFLQLAPQAMLVHADVWFKPAYEAVLMLGATAGVKLTKERAAGTIASIARAIKTARDRAIPASEDGYNEDIFLFLDGKVKRQTPTGFQETTRMIQLEVLSKKMKSVPDDGHWVIPIIAAIPIILGVRMRKLSRESLGSWVKQAIAIREIPLPALSAKWSQVWEHLVYSFMAMSTSTRWRDNDNIWLLKTEGQALNILAQTLDPYLIAVRVAEARQVAKTSRHDTSVLEVLSSLTSALTGLVRMRSTPKGKELAPRPEDLDACWDHLVVRRAAPMLQRSFDLSFSTLQPLLLAIFTSGTTTAAPSKVLALDALVHGELLRVQPARTRPVTRTVADAVSAPTRTVAVPWDKEYLLKNAANIRQLFEAVIEGALAVGEVKDALPEGIMQVWKAYLEMARAELDGQVSEIQQLVTGFCDSAEPSRLVVVKELLRAVGVFDEHRDDAADTLRRATFFLLAKVSETNKTAGVTATVEELLKPERDPKEFSLMVEVAMKIGDDRLWDACIGQLCDLATEANVDELLLLGMKLRPPSDMERLVLAWSPFEKFLKETLSKREPGFAWLHALLPQLALSASRTDLLAFALRVSNTCGAARDDFLRLLAVAAPSAILVLETDVAAALAPLRATPDDLFPTLWGMTLRAIVRPFPLNSESLHILGELLAYGGDRAFDMCADTDESKLPLQDLERFWKDTFAKTTETTLNYPDELAEILLPMCEAADEDFLTPGLQGTQPLASTQASGAHRPPAPRGTRSANATTVSSLDDSARSMPPPAQILQMSTASLEHEDSSHEMTTSHIQPSIFATSSRPHAPSLSLAIPTGDKHSVLPDTDELVPLGSASGNQGAPAGTPSLRRELHESNASMEVDSGESQGSRSGTTSRRRERSTSSVLPENRRTSQRLARGSSQQPTGSSQEDASAPPAKRIRPMFTNAVVEVTPNKRPFTRPGQSAPELTGMPAGSSSKLPSEAHDTPSQQARSMPEIEHDSSMASSASRAVPSPSLHGELAGNLEALLRLPHAEATALLAEIAKTAAGRNGAFQCMRTLATLASGAANMLEQETQQGSQEL